MTTENSLEIWGGIECTVNRVRETYSNQLIRNGHQQRESDLELFKSLGIKKIRYPVLWETVAPESLDEQNWNWPDQRLTKLNELELTPIVGLLHHGSGPKYTSLLDEEFPQMLARYASLVAARYPWVEWYTPVNEPLTTARFSALYGFWYPHTRDDRSFVRALLNEIKGTVLAMKEIRKINPNAKLVQTDDLGKASATPPIQYQADWENERRWLTFDLLFGRVDEHHSLFKYLVKHGATAEELAWFRENQCPPDIIGVNHYPLSNRFLDHRLELYPEQFHGGNGRDRYVDVGAVDTGQAVPPSPLEVLRGVWQRYEKPFAVTEVHIGGPRESQLRWLNELHFTAKQLRAEGADIRAITAWALLGSYDWTSLCTVENNHYESGVFDVRRDGGPRQTALAAMLKSFASDTSYDHAVLDSQGYWHSTKHVLYAPNSDLKIPEPWFNSAKVKRPIVITGARGTLGRAFARICENRGIDSLLLSRDQMDIADINSVRQALQTLKPWAVINAAGYVRVDEAEHDRERCLRENTLGPKNLATVCAELNIQFLTFSSDFVFDGETHHPYSESSPVRPVNTYGVSKAEAEKEVLQVAERSLIVRTSSFFGPWDQYNFAYYTNRSLRAGEVVRAAGDVVMSPTYVPDLVFSCLDLLIDNESGIIHLTNAGQLSWAEWARKAANSIGASETLVESCSIQDFHLPARRPRYTAMTSERLHIMPPFEDAWERYIRSVQ